MSHTSAGTDSKQISGYAKAKPQRTKNTPDAKNEPDTSGQSGDEIHRKKMISIAAYFRSERRGFEGGDPVEDWLAAEAEIDEMLDNLEGANFH